MNGRPPRIPHRHPGPRKIKKLRVPRIRAKPRPERRIEVPEIEEIEPLYTTAETAKALGVSIRTVHRWHRHGKIESTRPHMPNPSRRGGAPRLKFRLSEIKRVLNEREDPNE